MNKTYIDAIEAEQYLLNKQVYIFGAAVDGEIAYNKLSNKLDIIAFIDNKRFGGPFCGKPIISFSEYLKEKSENTVIIIAAYRFYREIGQQVDESGLTAGKEYYVWDDLHIIQPDEVAIKYTQFMSNIWNSHKIESESQILIPFDNRHDYDSIIYAYCANYLAQEYKASIVAFSRGGADINNASKVLLDIYHAINMQSLVDTRLNKELQLEANILFDQLWENLYTWSDWNNIVLYGVNFGSSIISEYMRDEVPCFDLREMKAKMYVKKKVETIVFWNNYFETHDVKAVLLADAVCWEGYIRDIANSRNIPTYLMQYAMERTYLKFHSVKTDAFKNYKKMWNTLSKEEQEFGIKWAKEHIEKRMNGSVSDLDIFTANNYTFAEKRKSKIISDKNKINVVIFPHIFEEDTYQCGEQIFDNSYIAWLCHLGELSEITPYNWYIKMHPASSRKDPIVIGRLLEKYQKIKLIPSDISPLQLKEEGVDFALTIYGTLGHEFPAIGIQVINAGENPHSAFDFNWNPKSKEEYDQLLLHLDELEPKVSLEELYIFYCMHYLYYDREYIDWKHFFFINQDITLSRVELKVQGRGYGTWKYEEYMKEWTPERHKEIVDKIPLLFKLMDEWNPNVFYRKEERI